MNTTISVIAGAATKNVHALTISLETVRAIHERGTKESEHPMARRIAASMAEDCDKAIAILNTTDPDAAAREICANMGMGVIVLNEACRLLGIDRREQACLAAAQWS